MQPHDQDRKNLDAGPAANLGTGSVKSVCAFLASLVAAGQIEAGAAARAADAQQRTSEPLIVILNELGLIASDVLTDRLSEYFEIPITTKAALPMEAVLPERLRLDFLSHARLLPLSLNEADIVVATSDPFNTAAIAALGYAVDRSVVLRILPPRDLEEALTRLYDTTPGADEVVAETLTVRDDDLQRLKDAASEAPVIRLVNRLLTGAAEAGASDVHIEPLADDGIVRYRIDGALVIIERLSVDLMPGVASRIKIISKLNIAERRAPQDGRTRINVGGRQIDVRVSCVPTQHGESIVLRLLDKERVELSFASLGVDGHGLNTLTRLLEQPNGIILVTGPTGSGKTTTLYTALKGLNQPDRKLFSVEDPIEVQLAGVNQMQVKREIGVDFIHCLRAILRQDPDVIMIGEIRDQETARTAIQASLTGHLVLSTLHTNSAAASITRLIDMGVEDYLLASSLLGVVAQRLVRRLCQCARPSPQSRMVIQRLLADDRYRQPRMITFDHLREPVGCQNCRGTGYRGRTALTEALQIDEAMRKLIVHHDSDQELDHLARSGGMETLLGCGLRKTLAGETSLDEVMRVTRFA
jgi:general secretion pathway protein E